MPTVRELEALARARLDPARWDFLAGGAGDEITVRANEDAYVHSRLVPRVLRGVEKRELGASLLGCRASMPVLIAPTAFHRLFHPDGERATARAAAAADTVMIVSMASTIAVAEVVAAARAAAAPGVEPSLWFQLYPQPDRRVTEALVRRAEDAGCRALVVTVDSPVSGGRERDVRPGLRDLPAGMWCENMRDLLPGEEPDVRRIELSAALTWADIAWLRGITSLPVVLKGILHPADAELAVRSEVDAIVVSNHGGRRLDTAPATLEALPGIVDAVGGAIPVLVDGGVRRGTDVVKALALGAAAVCVGRPVVWGLTVAGERGVTEVLETLRAETDRALALCGAATPAHLRADQVRCGPGVRRWHRS
ncbi:MAG TPA: alpha-hydroxy acid oxidase [Actinophytocola sp.]|uniref:alpha-hydroxy acid oxidase n=1 Tax=Actinophytocola sp. TaxID=1872138 RepID=UPI002DDD7BD1|nr:alpha-hydroxy acid oxidase [Actinophytocola sp.]HEV2782274.1 alpha-hydroxy acid oxidase [Actinophytocola sp.]